VVDYAEYHSIVLKTVTEAGFVIQGGPRKVRYYISVNVRVILR